MKIGFFCESPADQAAMAIFTEGILGEPPEPIGMDLEARGVGGVLRGLDGVFRGVHYNSVADGLIVVVDSDDTRLHSPEHEKPDADLGDCRFCRIHAIISRARSQLKPAHRQSPLKVAIGLAVPAIEAWYLTGRNHEVGEPAWRAALASGHTVFTRPELKRLVYGTDRPAIELQTQRAIDESRRVIGNLPAIETAFPMGFGFMASEIRSWKA
ncbi:MAG TPA: hypothetical protein VGJ04_08325 [Pirellulales bacterium]|jgi:hypothetical protein